MTIHAGARRRPLAHWALAPWAIALMAAALCASALALCASCGRGQRGSLGLVDGALAYLQPSARAAFGSVAREVVVLPSEDAQAALYAAVDHAKPEILYLSPLLAAEIGTLLSRDELVRVAYLGPARPAAHPRLFAAVFSSDDSAALAASSLAAELGSRADRAEEATVVALFSGQVAESGAPEAFRAAFEASGAEGRLRLERSPGGFSQSTAEALRRTDVRAAYVSAPASELERWTSQAFDDYAFVVAEAPLAEAEDIPGIDTVLRWDMEKTLEALELLVRRGEAGQVPGVWEAMSARE